MRSLDKMRQDIDQLDDQILSLIAKRFKVVEEVGKYKKQNDMPPLQPGRWQQVVAKIRAKANKLNLNPNMIEQIWNIIHKQAQAEEQQVIDED